MEDIRIIGASKIDAALERMRAMLQAHENDGTRINDVAIIVDLTEKVDGADYNCGSLLYSCSEERGWVQQAFFERAALATLVETAPVEDDG